MELVIVLTVCFLLIGLGFLLRARREAAERASHWTAVVEKLDETDGLRIPRSRGGGVNHVQKGRHIIWVHYRRDNGVEGHFFVGEPGNWRGWNEEPGKPDYENVKQHWTIGSRLEKPAGAAFPHLVS